jgi:hypothetical protein
MSAKTDEPNSFDLSVYADWLARSNRGVRGMSFLVVLAFLVFAVAVGVASIRYAIALPKVLVIEIAWTVAIALGLRGFWRARRPPDTIRAGADVVEFLSNRRVEFTWRAGISLPTFRLRDRSGSPASAGAKPFSQELRWGRDQLEVPLTPEAYTALVDWLLQHNVSLTERLGVARSGLSYRELRHR